MPGSLDTDLEFRCPRCAQAVTERFYGPCAACRERLVAAFSTDRSGGGAEVGTEVGAEVGAAGLGAARFEPGMHVVPNHVATKD